MRVSTDRSGGAVPNHALASDSRIATVIVSPILVSPKIRLSLICCSVSPMSVRRL
jgi:hypothetical protein